MALPVAHAAETALRVRRELRVEPEGPAIRTLLEVAHQAVRLLVVLALPEQLEARVLCAGVEAVVAEACLAL